MDESKDWNLIKFAENGTHTLIEFWRHFLTCDAENDLEIFDDEFQVSNIIFSYSFIDPQNIGIIGPPEFEKIIHLNLFNSDEEFEIRENDTEEINYWLNVINC